MRSRKLNATCSRLRRFAGQSERVRLLRGGREQSRPPASSSASIRLNARASASTGSSESSSSSLSCRILVERQAQQPRGIVAALVVAPEPEQVFRDARRDSRAGRAPGRLRGHRVAQQREARVDRAGRDHPGILGAAAALRRHDALIGAAGDPGQPARHHHVSAGRAHGKHAQADAARGDAVGLSAREHRRLRHVHELLRDEALRLRFSFLRKRGKSRGIQVLAEYRFQSGTPGRPV